MLNKNRNPNLGKKEITNNLLNYLGAKKIIWILYGVFNDDMNDPQYHHSGEALKILKASADAYNNRKIKVTKPINHK